MHTWLYSFRDTYPIEELYTDNARAPSRNKWHDISVNKILSTIKYYVMDHELNFIQEGITGEMTC